MEIFIALVLAIVISFACKPAIKRWPVAWYIGVVVLDIVFMTHVLSGVAPALDRSLYAYFNRGLLAFGFFVVVMFIGVFDGSSKVRQHLNPIRGELSIIGALLCLPHIVNYLMVYLKRIFAGFSGILSNIVVSFVVAVIVTVVLAVLTVTSFDRIRKAMTPAKWKRVQKWAYPFFILMYVHVVVALGPSALSGAGRARTSLIIYTVITVLYVALRLWKVARDRAADAARASTKEPREN